MSDRPFETEPLRQALLERRRTLSGLSSVWVSTTRKSTSVPVSIRRCAAHVLVSFMAGFLDFDITVSLRGGLWRDAAPARFLSEYDERMFWSQLADRLAARDLAADAAATGTVLSEQERFVRRFEVVDGYEQEFAENDLENLRLVTEPTSRMH